MMVLTTKLMKIVLSILIKKIMK